MQITLGEAKTKYAGRKMKVATLSIGGRKAVPLGLNDTARCAQGDGASGEEISARVLRNVVRNISGDPEFEPTEQQALELHLYCRQVLGLAPPVEKAA